MALSSLLPPHCQPPSSRLSAVISSSYLRAATAASRLPLGYLSQAISSGHLLQRPPSSARPPLPAISLGYLSQAVFPLFSSFSFAFLRAATAAHYNRSDLAGHSSMQRIHKMHSVPFTRLRELSVISTSIGHTCLHLPQCRHFSSSFFTRSSAQ